MTTETNDSNDPVKPQVIDLDATDVTPDIAPKEESAPPPPPPPPKKRAASGSSRWIIAALVLGLILGAWLFRTFLSSYFPSSEMTALSDRVSTLEATSKTQGNQLAAVSSATDEAKATASSLDAAVKDAASQSAAAQSALAGIDQRLTALKGDVDGLKKTIAAAGTGGGGDPAALAALSQRLDALEKQVNDFKTGGVTPATAADVSNLRQSLSDIQAKIAAGAPYRSELDAILRVVPSVGADEVLMANADQGLPNAKGLAEELRKAIPTLPQPDKPTPESDGWFDGFWNALSMIVTVRDVGETDWPTVAGQVAQEAEQGNLTPAISIIDAAEGSLPQPIAAWRTRAASRIKLEASAVAMAKAVGLVIAAKGGGQ
ncbi:COG4223 family protein [Aestuariivirga sp.]|uniref:COG4223 family protein n=1 Tax=Aestuariivirga sp. TaxID=2650926 RepID=UPI0039E26C3F